MASPFLARGLPRPGRYTCPRCARLASDEVTRTSRRWIGEKYLAKVADAEMSWQDKASRIREGKEQSMLSILEERGLVHTIAGSRDSLDSILTSRRIGAYVGIDPTAASLHVGHMLPLMSLFWMYVKGYHAVTLLGGATSKIGDPSGRLHTRDKQHSTVRTKNMLNMHYQLKKLWVNVEAYGRKYGYNWEWAWHRELVNNNAWMNKLGIMEVLQVLGPGMRMGSMLSRDTVKNKMSKGDGMSFAEFTYPLLQAWDWWHMYHTKNIDMQIGGSDQYGNITAGIDAVKYISAYHPDPRVVEASTSIPLGFTVPLLTTSSGQKFGKSAGNAIWLDSEQTSTFELYGFFLRTADADVEKYLKLFTFMPIADIEALVKQHTETPERRLAQHKLAREFLELVHGAEAAKAAEADHRVLFQTGGLTMVGKATQLESSASNDEGKEEYVSLNKRPSPNVQIPASFIKNKSIAKIVHAAGLTSSVQEAHRLIEQKALYIGGMPGHRNGPMDHGSVSFTRIELWDREVTLSYLIDETLLILRRGKHNIRVVEMVPDPENYVEEQVDPPDEKKINDRKDTRVQRRRPKVQPEMDWLKAALMGDGSGSAAGSNGNGYQSSDEWLNKTLAEKRLDPKPLYRKEPPSREEVILKRKLRAKQEKMEQERLEKEQEAASSGRSGRY